MGKHLSRLNLVIGGTAGDKSGDVMIIQNKHIDITGSSGFGNFWEREDVLHIFLGRDGGFVYNSIGKTFPYNRFDLYGGEKKLSVYSV